MVNQGGNVKNHYTIRFALIVAFGCLNIASAEIIWPADEAWTALRRGSDFYDDVEGDKDPASIDLIGTKTTYSAGFWAYVDGGYSNALSLAAAFMVRMRMGGESGNYVWQALLDTDGDASSVEWIFQLVQSGSGDGVILVKTAVGGPTLNDVNIGSNTAVWTGDIPTFSRWTPISGSTHYHVDIAVPWTTFESITGVSDLNDIRMVLSSSTTHAGINKDAPLGASLSDQVSNVLSDNIPEPAVASLLIGAGACVIFWRRIFTAPPPQQEESQP
jgi:hypothetical protein